MLKKYLVLLSFVLLIFMSSGVFAQRQVGEAPPVPKAPPPRNPIDGGLGILLVIGVGYAIKKLRKED